MRTPESSLTPVPQAALDACAREPIHLPGSIQPFGALLALAADTLRVTHASANAAALLGLAGADDPAPGSHADPLHGSPLAALAPSLAARLRTRLATAHEGELLHDRWQQGATDLRVQAHHCAGRVLVELFAERVGDPAAAAAAAAAVREIAALNRTTSIALPAFATQICEQMRAFTGYDRVMVYRFAADDSGEVIAEACAGGMEPFLGLHYPASDIPPQARALYLRKRVRVLGDAHAAPVPIRAASPADAAPVDLSHATLRSFSPVHLEYLHNMGVAASLVVSVIKDGRLWGLISCHHRTARWADAEMVAACDFLGELLTVQLTLRESVIRAEATARVHQASRRLTRAVVDAAEWPEALVGGEISLLDIVDASGAAVVRGDRVWTVGEAPEADDVRAIARWLGERPPARLTALDSLTGAAPAFEPLSDRASGLLAIEIAREEGCYICWFRPEWVHTVTWGGAPGKGVTITDAGPRLSPRRSFAAWQGEVRLAARPWSEGDRIAAELLRTDLVDDVLHLLAFKHLVVSEDLVRVRRAVEAAQEAMTIMDAGGRTIFANRAFGALFGVSPEAVRAGEAFGLLDGPFEDRTLPARMRQALDAGGPWQTETWMYAPAHGRLPVAVRGDRIVDDVGRHIGYVMVFGDLRERYRHAEEREALEAQMRQTQKLESLGVLAGGIAHDFNNLLTSILGNASLARLELGPDAPALEEVAQIERAAQRAAELCRQMLAYSGKGRFVIQPLDLNALVTEMRELLDTVLSKRARLVVAADPAIPPIEGDATQLRQVVMNLLTNASDALGDADGTITVRTAVVDVDRATLGACQLGQALPAGRYVRLEVADDGCGMDAATLARIFDPFFTTKFTGRGLGLAATLGILRGHRAALHVRSAPGDGTTFTLYVPVAAPAAPAVAAPAAASSPRRGSACTVLVVDDDAAIRRVAQRALERAGHRVLVAADGRAAIAAYVAAGGAVDAVLLDLVMPQLNGPETFEALRAHDPGVRVLLSSGYTEEDAAGRFAGSGVAAFIQKPYRAEELVERLEALVGRAAPTPG